MKLLIYTVIVMSKSQAETASMSATSAFYLTWQQNKALPYFSIQLMEFIPTSGTELLGKKCREQRARVPGSVFLLINIVCGLFVHHSFQAVAGVKRMGRTVGSMTSL